MAIAVAAALPASIVTTPALAQFISPILNPLVGAWLESEVDSVDNLSVSISGRDRDILGGTIERAEVSGDNLVRDGFHITTVQLDGRNIRLNTQAALRGESLRLIEPLPVAVQMRWSEADLNQSLQAPLIQSQLEAARVKLPFGDEQSVAFLIRDPQVTLQNGALQLDATLDMPGGDAVPISIATQLQAQNSNQLLLVNPVWLSGETAIPIEGLDRMLLDLGEDVSVTRLQLLAGELLYDGTVTIQP